MPSQVLLTFRRAYETLRGLMSTVSSIDRLRMYPSLIRTTEKTVELKATAKTVHQNFFDASLKPVLTINSGDTVRLETATGNPKYFERHGVPKDKIPQELYTAFEGLPYDESGPDRGRADATLDGPIKVNGAEPGDVLEVRIRSVQVRLPIAAQSFVPGRGLLPEDFPYEKHRVLFMDLDKQTVEYAPGIVVPLKPFWGIIGVAPPSSMGRVSSGPPNIFGGNMDNQRPRSWNHTILARLRSRCAAVDRAMATLLKVRVKYVFLLSRVP